MRYSRYHDLLSAIGWLSALQALRRLIPSAIVWLGVPCSQFVWISRGSTGRSRLRPRGSKKLKSVRRTNRLVRRVCYLFLGSSIVVVTTLAFGFNDDIAMFSSYTHCSEIVYSPPRLEYIHRKKAFWAIEQPASSLLPLYAPLEDQGERNI